VIGGLQMKISGCPERAGSWGWMIVEKGEVSGDPGAQVYCLKALRAMESGQGISDTYKDYKPDDPAVQARSLLPAPSCLHCEIFREKDL
jgi:hypothetical protein